VDCQPTEHGSENVGKDKNRSRRGWGSVVLSMCEATGSISRTKKSKQQIRNPKQIITATTKTKGELIKGIQTKPSSPSFLPLFLMQNNL
jgi:hypothetical protein